MKCWHCIPVFAALIITIIARAQAQESRSHKSSGPTTSLTYCALDGVYVFLRDSPGQTLLTEIEDVQLYAGGAGEMGAGFWFERNGKKISTFELEDLSAPGIWIAEDPANNEIALTYSDGGAIGGFHVRIFQVNGESVADLSKAVEPATRDFKSRHYCKTRGNNTQALKWIDGSLLLMTEVYPTGDCGRDLGHFEGYLVSVPGGSIQKHLTARQLEEFPGVCQENEPTN